MWSEGVRLIDAQLRLASEVDGKISPLIALDAGAIALILAQSKDVGDSAPLLLIELLVVLVFLFLAFGSREFAYAPALPALIEDANLEEGALKEHYLGNLREAYLLNLNALSVKFLYFRWAGWVILVFGLTVTAVGIAGALR